MSAMVKFTLISMTTRSLRITVEHMDFLCQTLTLGRSYFSIFVEWKIGHFIMSYCFFYCLEQYIHHVLFLLKLFLGKEKRIIS